MEKGSIFVADKDDVLSLSSLFFEVFGRRISKEELRWRYLENIEKDDSFIGNVVVKREDKILGHTGIIPTKLQLNNKPSIKAALSVASMVSNNSPGLFPLLLQFMIDQLKNNKYDLIYAFPNENAFPFLQKLFTFQQGFFSLLTIQAEKLRKTRYTGSDISLDNKIIKYSDQNYLDWRFGSFQKCLSVESDRLRIYYKQYMQDQCDILSIQSVGNLPFSMQEILVLLKSKNLNNFKTFNYLTTDPEIHKIFSSAGFIKKNISNKFVYLWLGEEQEYDNFSLQMSDNDW